MDNSHCIINFEMLKMMAVGCAILFMVLFMVTLLTLHVITLLDCDLTTLFYSVFGKPIRSLNGKVVWISGASSGIGEQLAYDLSKVGAKLILSGHLDTLYTVAEKCLKYSKGKLSSQDILVIPPFDIRETSKHEDVVKDAIKHFGRIDIMINNVGRSQRAKFTEIDISQDKEIFDINVFGQINLTRTVMRHFLERKSGHFVITSSVAGKFGAPYSATYTGSKYALIGYFESIRCEAYSQGIRVTTICPGPIQTPLVERSFHSKTFESEVQGASGKTEGKMSVRRCTFLMLVSIANQLNESWISLKPILWFLYTTQYFPELSKFFQFRFFPAERLYRMREGKSGRNNNDPKED